MPKRIIILLLAITDQFRTSSSGDVTGSSTSCHGFKTNMKKIIMPDYK
jgi:hypothetical protein